MVTVAEAVAQGADLVIGSLTLRNPDEAEDAQNVEVFSSCVSQKRELGLPLVGEVYPTGGDDKSPDELQEDVFIGSRIIAELGADLVKTFYTGKRFEEVTKACPVPVLALGAKKLPKESDALAPGGGRHRRRSARDRLWAQRDPIERTRTAAGCVERSR